MRFWLVPSLVFSPIGASAEELFSTTVANWTIEQIFDTCAAYNRPNSELQDAPIHVLGFQRSKDGVTSLIAAFWPGGLGEDENALQITLADLVVDVEAKPFLNDANSLRTGQLTDELLAALAGEIAAGTLITLRALPSQAEISFEAGELPAVMAALDACQAAP